jgi:head-tail adaptor
MAQKAGKMDRRVQLQTVSSKVVTIRHRSDLDHTGRIILDDGRIAIVAWISEVGRREALQIFVEVQQ